MFDVRYLPIGLAASVLFLLIHEIRLRLRSERTTWFHRVLVLITGIYLATLFALTISPGSPLSPPQLDHGVNLTPFKVWETIQSCPLNFWGNIALFIPFGFLLVLLFNQCQKFHVTVILGAGLSFLIELIQFFGIRNADIDDILLNTAGTIIGYLIGKLMLIAAPFLHKGVGIFFKKGAKTTRKLRDAGSIVVLAAFVLTSVMATGYILAGSISQIPAGPELVALKPTDAPESAKISADIDAGHAYVLDAKANAVLFERGGKERIAPASTAKMLTALTVLDFCRENDAVTVGPEIQMIADDASTAWLNTGNRLTIRQLLYALLLPSGNDAAYVLAVYTGRQICNDANASVEKALSAFMGAMNQKAATIGAVHSYFVNPDGYDADGQYTTAQDLAFIAKAFLETDILQDIAKSHRISNIWLSGQDVTYHNTNELINPESAYYYQYASGLKTGMSKEAGYCLVSCATIHGKLYICVIMGSTEQGRWRDSLALFRAIER